MRNAVAAYCACMMVTLGSCGSEKIRVMTFNIWNSGSHVEEGLRKVAKHILLIDPDVVALQVHHYYPGFKTSCEAQPLATISGDSRKRRSSLTAPFPRKTLDRNSQR